MIHLSKLCGPKEKMEHTFQNSPSDNVSTKGLRQINTDKTTSAPKLGLAIGAVAALIGAMCLIHASTYLHELASACFIVALAAVQHTGR